MTPERRELVAHAARWARWAYRDETPALGPEEKVIERENARAIVRELPDATEIAFAGTDDLSDALEDARAWPSRRAHVGAIHDGVADYYDLIREQLLAVIDPLKPKRVFGHSLGGAVAQRFAVGHAAKGGRVEAVVTFGSPMVGGHEFAACADAAGVSPLNFWAPGDLVPYLPSFLGFSLGYRRIGETLVFGPGGSVSRTSPSWWASAPWRKVGAARRLAHSMDAYAALAEALA